MLWRTKLPLRVFQSKSGKIEISKSFNDVSSAELTSDLKTNIANPTTTTNIIIYLSLWCHKMDPPLLQLSHQTTLMFCGAGLWFSNARFAHSKLKWTAATTVRICPMQIFAKRTLMNPENSVTRLGVFPFWQLFKACRGIFTPKLALFMADFDKISKPVIFPAKITLAISWAIFSTDFGQLFRWLLLQILSNFLFKSHRHFAIP